MYISDDVIVWGGIFTGLALWLFTIVGIPIIAWYNR